MVSIIAYVPLLDATILISVVLKLSSSLKHLVNRVVSYSGTAVKKLAHTHYQFCESMFCVLKSTIFSGMMMKSYIWGWNMLDVSSACVMGNHLIRHTMLYFSTLVTMVLWRAKMVEFVTWVDLLLEKYSLVPGILCDWQNCTTILEHRWYHNDIGSNDAEELLKNRGQDGSFLVRSSYSTPGDYSLCVRWAGIYIWHILSTEQIETKRHFNCGTIKSSFCIIIVAFSEL